MTTYTDNQQQAIKLIENVILRESDFDWGDYFWVSDLLKILAKNGWSAKQAEGTVGSLIEKGFVNTFEMVENPNKNDRREMLYVVYFDNDGQEGN